MDRRTLTITLELELDGDAFHGTARDDRGAARAFSGWLGLIASLDAMVASATPRSADQDTDATGAEAPSC